jgi:hypothetical protein
MQENKRNISEKKEVTLMTLLANEATDDSIKLLKKYKPNEKVYNFQDLEKKLADLYIENTDKIALEKQLAEIHPHKKWLLKYIQPKVEIKEKIVEVVKPIETKSNCEGNPDCQCNKKTDQSSFDGDNSTKSGIQLTMTDYVGISLVFAVIGLSFYAITKHNKI